MDIPCYLLEPTKRHQRWLRRYAQQATGACPGNPGRYSYHTARVEIATARGPGRSGDRWPHNDERWPKTCSCGYRFKKSDEWQLFCETIWKVTATMPGGPDVGMKFTLAWDDAPAGAMWYADWLDDIDRWKGPDGRTLVCRTPGGDWIIDSVARNCTKPDDAEHRCWIRTGEPPNVTAGKDGNTCAAGAGSIQAGTYHGFLRAGYLTNA